MIGSHRQKKHMAMLYVWLYVSTKDVFTVSTFFVYFTGEMRGRDSKRSLLDELTLVATSYPSLRRRVKRAVCQHQLLREQHTLNYHWICMCVWMWKIFFLVCKIQQCCLYTFLSVLMGVWTRSCLLLCLLICIFMGVSKIYSTHTQKYM